MYLLIREEQLKNSKGKFFQRSRILRSKEKKYWKYHIYLKDN